MAVQGFRVPLTAALLAMGLLAASAASAGVVVDITDSNTAVAAIALTDANNQTYNATVTITFDQAINLSADSLNLTAELIDPNNFSGLPAGVSIDPTFPVLISVEPPVTLFVNGYEANQTGDGNLAFFNTYYFEVHTTDLECSSASSQYRLFKAPHGSAAFADVSDDILHGSVRARGRGGAFSQFVVAKDARLPLTIAVGKLTNLTTRLLTSAVNGALLTTLTNLLTAIGIDLLTLNIGGAIADLDVFIVDVAGAAGTDIANEWKSDRSLNNDAGELISLAQTLRFTLTLLQGNALCLSN
jgi:hypothetical protein